MVVICIHKVSRLNPGFIFLLFWIQIATFEELIPIFSEYKNEKTYFMLAVMTLFCIFVIQNHIFEKNGYYNSLRYIPLMQGRNY